MNKGERCDSENVRFKECGTQIKYVRNYKAARNLKRSLKTADLINNHDSKECSTYHNDKINITKNENNYKEQDQQRTKNPCSLFPAINKGQFIPGNDQFIPLLHDTIR